MGAYILLVWRLGRGGGGEELGKMGKFGNTHFSDIIMVQKNV
jgi:hypothetical protein